MNRKIMEMTWTDEGDGDTPFTADSIGDDEVADRLNTAAEYLVSKYNIDIVEARNRLWNRGDFFPRLLIVEAES